MKNFIMAAKYLEKSFWALTLLAALPVHAQTGYWQQRVDTKIDVALDDTNHVLNGRVTLNYVNHSPDTLRFIDFHLYPNAFKNDRTAFDSQMVANGNTEFYYSQEDKKGYIDSLDFTVDGRSAALNTGKNIDEARLALPMPLAPGDSIIIATPFRVKLPYVFSRMGHVGQAYQVAHWYPQPAVYDAKGWHQFPYLNQGEFYGEFGTYDVSVTLPRNYVLMATGDMVDAPLEQQWLDSLAELPLPADTIYQHGFPPSSAQSKTIHFHAEKVHDFAWFADKGWIVRKDSFTIPGTNRQVAAYSCFLPKHEKSWRISMNALKTAIDSYSVAVGTYPYASVKVVDGALQSDAGGMEYPTIAVIAASNNPDMIFTDIVHEVGHNWFYGVLGSNERVYPWMDEGINSFYDHRYAPNSQKILSLDLNKLTYATSAAVRELQAADTLSTAYTGMNYFVDIYEKTPLYLDWLEAYMGKPVFRAAMQDYYQTWQFRHPQPQDFKWIFEQHATKDISWFFKAMGTHRPVDFAIRSVRYHGDSVQVNVKNKTGLDAPALLSFESISKNNDSVSDTVKQLSWTKPFSVKTSVMVARPAPAVRWQQITLAPVVPDFNATNNAQKNPLALRAFAGLNTGHYHKTWLLPAIGYNYDDGFMVGLVLHNLTIPQNRFQFALSPLYGTSSNKIGGTGFLSYTTYLNSGWLHDWQINLSGKAFSYDKSDLNLPEYMFAGYQKISPELVFHIRKPFPRSPVDRQLILRGYWIREESLAYRMSPSDSLYRPVSGPSEDYVFGKLRYEYENRRTFNPFGYALEGLAGKDFAKISATAHLRIDYYLENKAFYIRAFAGKLMDLSGKGIQDQRYELTTTYSGINDYLYDETFIGRHQNTGFWANQIAMNDGGFKMNTLQYARPVGLSDNWLAALNLSTDLPFGKLPLQIFGDLAALPKSNGEPGMNVLYEAGIALHIGNTVSFYLPLLMSKDLTDYSKSVLGKNRLLKSISMSINLNGIPWTKMSDLLLKLQ